MSGNKVSRIVTTLSTEEVAKRRAQMSDEERAKRQEEFKKIQNEGHTIELTTQPEGSKHSGVSYDYMYRLKDDIDAGIFEDENKDGFAKQDRQNLGKEFGDVFSEHNYSTNFTDMNAGSKYEISYDDYVRLAKAAGYVLSDNFNGAKKLDIPAGVIEPAKIEPAKIEAFKAEIKPLDIKPLEMNNDKDENVTVVLDETTYEDSEGNVFARRGYGNVNGEHVDLNEGSLRGNMEDDMSDLAAEEEVKETGNNPFGAGKKVATEPNAIAAQAKAETPATPVEQPEVPVTTPETKVPEVKVETPETKVETPETKDEAPEVKDEAQAAVPATSDSEPVNGEEGIKKVLADIPGDTPEARLEYLKSQEKDLQAQISELKRTPTYTTKKFLFFGGKTKEVALTPEEQAQRKQEADKLQEDLFQLKRYTTYVNEVEVRDNWNGTKYASEIFQDPETKDIIKEYPSYKRVTVVDANGNERKAAQIDTYDRNTNTFVSSFYGLDVKESKYGSAPKYWTVVPDTNNQLEGYTLKR